MIAERRQILFSPEALLEAARLYSALPQQNDLPLGLIASVSISGTGADPVLDVVMQQSGASQLRKLSLTGPKILAALILLCRKRQIPVPRLARKALAVEGQSLVVTLSCADYSKAALVDTKAA